MVRLGYFMMGALTMFLIFMLSYTTHRLAIELLTDMLYGGLG